MTKMDVGWVVEWHFILHHPMFRSILPIALRLVLLTGNTNIVRVPGKDFEQVVIISEAIRCALNNQVDMKPYIALVRYGHDKAVNDTLSAIADTRIVWGGDATIATLRQSALPPRSTEVLFADRYSLAVIDSDVYMRNENKKGIAAAFYNDTFLTDQNACTSPRIVIWRGSEKSEAKEIFWRFLHEIVKERYTYQDIQGVNKLTSSFLSAVALEGVHIVPSEDNLIVRMSVQKIDKRMPEFMNNSGFFFECDCDDAMELWDVCNDKRCQTVGMLGDREWLMPLIRCGVKGIDRITEIGHTMYFDLIWDGYNLTEYLTRRIDI